MSNDLGTPIEKAIPTVVLLCEDLAKPGIGLKLKELRSSLEASSPGVSVEIVPDLCGHLEQLSQIKAEGTFERVVLGLCSQEHSQIELQIQARKIGLDPFGLEIVPLGTLCAGVHPEPQATGKARVLLAAAVARARAFPAGGPENTKLYFTSGEQKVSRRSLFTIPPIGYRPVPSIRRGRCVAGAGCQLCVAACPLEALQKTGSHIFLDKTSCEGCGVCLAACPREAFNFPGWSLPQFEAQLDSLLGSSTPDAEPVGLLLTCEKAVGKLEGLAGQGTPYSHQWLPVVIPCLGMVTPTWILQLLAGGADAVTLLFCGADCPFGQKQAIGGMVSFCRQLLLKLEQAPGRVRLVNASLPERLLNALKKPPPRQRNGHRSRSGERLRLGALEGTYRAISHLAASAGVPSSKIVLKHPHSPFGVVELRSEYCTGCLVCVKACPSEALTSESVDGDLTITFAASLCNGCGMCAAICPETANQVLQVSKTTDLDTLSQDKVVLHSDQMAICKGCGAAIASRAMLRRIESSLAEDNESLRTVLSSYCDSCRSDFAWGAKPSTAQSGEGT